jgi:hypothetical protein
MFQMNKYNQLHLLVLVLVVQQAQQHKLKALMVEDAVAIS